MVGGGVWSQWAQHPPPVSLGLLGAEFPAGICLLLLIGAFILVGLKTFLNASDLARRSPGCCCFELLGDVALRTDTGDWWLLVPGRSRDWYRPKGRSTRASVGGCGYHLDLRGRV